MLKLFTSGTLPKAIVPFTLPVLLAVIFSILLPRVGNAQLKNKDLSNLNKDKQFFYADPLVFYSKDSSKARLDLYLEIPMDNLQFRWDASQKKYAANADIDVVITTPGAGTVTRETFTDLLSHTKAEQKTVIGKSEYITKHFYLEPGRYDISINIRDNNNQSEHSKNLTMDVSDYTGKEVGVSDVMFVSEYKDNANGKKSITPLVNTNVGSLNNFYLFFEVYNNNEHLLKKDLAYKIVDNKNNEVAKGKFDYLLQPGVNQKIEKLSTKDLGIGEYELQISDAVTSEKYISKDFDFKWGEMPANIKDLDLAISQTIYIATTDEFDAMKDAKTPEQKQKEFLKFWRSKDPSPNTSKNEIMIDYYNRVKTANERYSNYFDGWKSDMGMVYIMYGDPSSIERYPFTSNSKPYEIWDYYDVNRRFVFVDNTGFGDYRLTTPIYDQDRSRAY